MPAIEMPGNAFLLGPDVYALPMWITLLPKFLLVLCVLATWRIMAPAAPKLRRTGAALLIALILPLFGPLGWLHYYVLPLLCCRCCPALPRRGGDRPDHPDHRQRARNGSDGSRASRQYPRACYGHHRLMARHARDCDDRAGKFVRPRAAKPPPKIRPAEPIQPLRRRPESYNRPNLDASSGVIHHACTLKTLP